MILPQQNQSLPLSLTTLKVFTCVLTDKCFFFYLVGWPTSRGDIQRIHMNLKQLNLRYTDIFKLTTHVIKVAFMRCSLHILKINHNTHSAYCCIPYECLLLADTLLF